MNECPECGLPADRYGPDHPWDCGPPEAEASAQLAGSTRFVRFLAGPHHVLAGDLTVCGLQLTPSWRPAFSNAIDLVLEMANRHHRVLPICEDCLAGRIAK